MNPDGDIFIDIENNPDDDQKKIMNGGEKGALPGVSGAGEFYKDDVTLRTGLPRYAIAALRFAVVHQTHPKALDAAFLNEPKTYYPDALDPAKKRGQGKDYVVVRDEEFDNGPHFPITPAGKKLVDDTVWKLVGKEQ